MRTTPSTALRWLTLVLLAWVVVLHFRFLMSAGPLWRDEAQSAAQAGLTSWHALKSTLDFDTFPPLYPALLKAAASMGLPLTDVSLRSTSVVLGLMLAGSVVVGLRLVGIRCAWVTPLLLLADPLLITEGDSVRPYGPALLGLFWLWVLTAKHLMDRSARWLGLATAAAVFSVQVSYANAVFVGVVGVSSLVLEIHARRGRNALLQLIPGVAAAVSLLPFAGHLSAAGSWARVLKYAPDWRTFAESYLSDQSGARAIAWTAVILLAVCRGRQGWRLDRSPGLFSIVTALAGWGIQIGFVHAADIPLFPRYFLPCAMLFGVVLEVHTRHVSPGVRLACAFVVLALTANSSWRWVGLRRSNMDAVASQVSRLAGARDLVVVSPWFLHTSFQRYYSGRADWTTVPPLERQPVIRYDLVRDLMISGGSLDELESSIQRFTGAGGSVWLVSQVYPVTSSKPSVPPRPRTDDISGITYSAFRSYWERGAEFALLECCGGQAVPAPAGDPVWREEALVVSRWAARPGPAEGFRPRN